MEIIVWLLPIISGLADAASRGAIKLTKVHRLTLVAGGFFFALPYYMVWLMITGLPHVNPKFWIVIAVEVPLLAIANVMVVEAHRRSPLMIVAPMQTLLPILLLATTPIMGKLLYPSPLLVEWPTIFGGAGVMIAVSGLYCLNYQKNQSGLLASFRQLAIDPGLRFMCLVLVIFSITSNLDFLGFSYSNAPFFLAVVHGLTGLAAALTLLFYVSTGEVAIDEALPKGLTKAVVIYGFFIAFGVIPHIMAFKWISFVPYVIIGKRTGAVIFAVVIAFIIASLRRFEGRYASERENLAYRLIGITLMLAGMAIVIWLGKGSL
ncbi:MAG: hypothetical protein PHF50_02780 [Patescibacteria group bacterium]|nr:hypothetical protein [Patescibacteria group bacterium]